MSEAPHSLWTFLCMTAKQTAFWISWSNQLRLDKEFGLILTVMVMTKMSRAFTFPKTCKMNTNPAVRKQPRNESVKTIAPLNGIASIYVTSCSHDAAFSMVFTHCFPLASPRSLTIMWPATSRRRAGRVKERVEEGLDQSSQLLRRHTLTVHTFRYKTASDEPDADWIHLKNLCFATSMWWKE